MRAWVSRWRDPWTLIALLLWLVALPVLLYVSPFLSWLIVGAGLAATTYAGIRAERAAEDVRA